MDVLPISPWFASASLELAHACQCLGLVAPSFRSPPLLPGVNRTLRRLGDHERPVVAVRLWGRGFEAIRADMVDGVLAANGIVRGSVNAVRLRAMLEELVPIPRRQEAA